MAVTCSPVVTSRPPSNASTSSAKSMPRKCRRTVSAVAVRSRCVSSSRSRPSSPDVELDLAAEHVDGRSRSMTRATACSSPWLTARCRAAAATVSAPAMANRALTPERWSTALDSRSNGEAGEDLDEVVGHGRDEMRLRRMTAISSSTSSG